MKTSSALLSVKKYGSLVKFAHTIFAMPFALTAFLLALNEPGVSFSWILLLQILVCMVAARNTSLGFNRYADRKIDALNPRTALRDIPAGRVTEREAAVFCIVNGLVFVITALTINKLCFYLSFVALLFLCGYSYLKRFTWLCHFGVGASLCIAPAGAYIAVTGHLSPAVCLLSAVVFFWSSGFDIIYALSDEEIDRAQGLHSIPQRFGRRNAMIISIAVHLFDFVLVPMFVSTAELGTVAWIGAGLFLAMLAYQHLIVSPTDLRRLDAAFFTSNGIASLIFAVAVYLDVLL